MKFYTHPKLSLTTIQTKDGALYSKRWLFFKPTLFLEIDLTSHRTWQLPEKSKIYDKSTINFNKVSVNSTPKQK